MPQPVDNKVVARPRGKMPIVPGSRNFPKAAARAAAPLINHRLYAAQLFPRIRGDMQTSRRPRRGRNSGPHAHARPGRTIKPDTGRIKSRIYSRDTRAARTAVFLSFPRTRSSGRRSQSGRFTAPAPNESRPRKARGPPANQEAGFTAARNSAARSPP